MLTPRRRGAGARGDFFNAVIAELATCPWCPSSVSDAWLQIESSLRAASGHGLLTEHPLDAAHHHLALEAGNDLGEVVEVPDFELDLDFGEVLGAAHHPHIVDVAVGLADDLRDLCQRTGFVERRYDDLGGKAFGIIGVDVPGHVDPPLVLEIFELWRMDLEDADAATVGEHADDAIARHRPAFFKLHGYVVPEPADREHLGLLGFRPAAAGPAEFQPHHFRDVEPTLLGLAPLAALALARCRLLAELRLGHHSADDVFDGELAAADASVDVLDRFLRQPGEALLEPLVAVLLADPAEGGDKQAPAELGVLPSQGVARGAANGGAGLAGDGDAFPGGGWGLPLGHQDLDLVAVLELGGEGQLASVDDRTDAGVANVGVNRVGEINGCCAARERDEATLRGKAEHLILEQLEFGVLQEFLGIVAFKQGVDQAA